MNNAVFLIENNFDNASDLQQIIAALGYKTTRVRASSPVDVMSDKMTCSPNVIVCHPSLINPITQAIMQSNRLISLILSGSDADIPMFEIHFSIKIGYSTAPLSPDELNAIINLLV